MDSSNYSEEQCEAYIGKLCHDMDNKKHMFMVYDMYWKINHKGGMSLAYKYISLPTGRLGEAPVSHFHGDAAFVRWL